eukprot:COSAG02_NODE_206_length_29144_cov_12.855121_34_plen_210_part_00
MSVSFRRGPRLASPRAVSRASSSRAHRPRTHVHVVDPPCIATSTLPAPDNCNLRLTSISRIPRLKTEMQPEFSQWGGQTPAQRLFAASDDGLPRAAGPRGACCRRVCARAGAGSRRIVLRWGTRVVGGLWRRGEGAVVWCLLTPSFRAAARKRVLGRLHEVFSRTNHGIGKNGAREPSPTVRAQLPKMTNCLQTNCLQTMVLTQNHLPR